MATVTVLRPDEPEPAVASVTLARRRALPERPVLGLVANGKPLAKELLHAVSDALARRIGSDIAIHLLEKPSAAYQISAEQADVMAVRSHIVITGLGD